VERRPARHRPTATLVAALSQIDRRSTQLWGTRQRKARESSEGRESQGATEQIRKPHHYKQQETAVDGLTPPAERINHEYGSAGIRRDERVNRTSTGDRTTWVPGKCRRQDHSPPEDARAAWRRLSIQGPGSPVKLGPTKAPPHRRVGRANSDPPAALPILFEGRRKARPRCPRSAPLVPLPATSTSPAGAPRRGLADGPSRRSGTRR